MTPIPKILLLGDSISIGYTPHVARELAGRFAVARHEGNSGDSANVLARLDDWLAADAALIHFNVGLHDLRLYPDGRHQVALDDYRRNLAEIVRRLRAAGRRPLIWATITPVIDRYTTKPGLPWLRRNETVVAYNAAARQVVGAAGIPVNDLYTLVMEAGPDRCLREDGVHMTDSGYEILGRAVARAIVGAAPRLDDTGAGASRPHRSRTGRSCPGPTQDP